MMDTLQIRLLNCLQTIIDIQPALRRIYRVAFAEDFAHLKSYAAQISSMRLEEEEVARLESLTAAFLREMEFAGSSPAMRQLQ